MDTCKSLNINIRTVMKKAEMLKYKQMRNYEVKNLSYLLRYVPDRYKTKKYITELFFKMMEH